MKVAHITPWYHPAYLFGGPPESAHQLSRYLARAGCEVRVLTTDANGPSLSVDAETERDLPIEPGLHVRYCRRRVPGPIAPALFARFPGWVMAPSLVAAIPGHVAWCDVVHLNAVYNFTTFPTLAAARALGRPVVWTTRGALTRWKDTRRPKEKEVWEAAARAIAPRRTVLHVTSEAEEKPAAERMRWMRTRMIPNGVEVPPEAPRPAPSDTLRILFLGRLHPIKGLENLVEACGLLRQRQPAFHLTLAGGGEAPFVAALQKAVKDRTLEGHVTFLGETPPSARARLFAEADLFIMPSFTENFGLAIAEALAHAVPVIAGKGTPWSGLLDHDAGLWVPNDPESLAAAIASMRDRPLVAMGARGRAWVERDLGWGRVASEMKALYESLVAEPR